MSKETAEEWINQQGIASQYRCAQLFTNNGFTCAQHEFYESSGGHMHRVELMASRDHSSDHYFLRMINLVKCYDNTTNDLIVLTSPNGNMSPVAVIAQSIANIDGRSLLDKICGDRELAATTLFHSPSPTGFELMETKTDKIIADALNNIVVQLIARLQHFDPHGDEKKLKAYALGFGILVTNGSLYEAVNDPSSGKLKLTAVSTTRIHWRGSPEWELAATIDIVTEAGLETFIETRRRDFDILGKVAGDAISSK